VNQPATALAVAGRNQRVALQLLVLDTYLAVVLLLFSTRLQQSLLSVLLHREDAVGLTEVVGVA
jgi:hypothetical protein